MIIVTHSEATDTGDAPFKPYASKAYLKKSFGDELDRLRDRYDEIATTMCCFKQADAPCLKTKPLRQIWRDHLLAGVLKQAGGYEYALFLFLYPSQNSCCKDAVDAYRACLTFTSSFVTLTLEEIVAEIKRHTFARWIDQVYDRYLDFGKIDAMFRTMGIEMQT